MPAFLNIRVISARLRTRILLNIVFYPGMQYILQLLRIYCAGSEILLSCYFKYYEERSVCLDFQSSLSTSAKNSKLDRMITP